MHKNFYPDKIFIQHIHRIKVVKNPPYKFIYNITQVINRKKR